MIAVLMKFQKMKRTGVVRTDRQTDLEVATSSPCNDHVN